MPARCVVTVGDRDLDGLGARRHHPLVFVADLQRPRLEHDDHHHLARALRLRTGDAVVLGDGAGRWRMAEFDHVPVPTSDVRDEPRRRRWGVAFALVKGDRPELVVQKLTELGAEVILPVISDRTVVRWSVDKVDKQHRRHRRIAREAAMQSRQVHVPTVEPAGSLAAVFDRYPTAVLADPAAGVSRVGGRGDDGPAVVVVGPEGGFTPAEMTERATVALPGGILRTETAALAAGVLLAAGLL